MSRQYNVKGNSHKHVTYNLKFYSFLKFELKDALKKHQNKNKKEKNH